MALHLISQTLKSKPSNSMKLTHRLYSNQSSKAQLIELDLESSSEETQLGLKKLEEAIHSIIVRQSAPDWLPFIPGSSYWVPPPRHHHRNKNNGGFSKFNSKSGGIVGLLRNFMEPNGEEMSVSVLPVKGWPSSAYFIEGTTAIHPVTMEMEAEVIHSNEENMPDTEKEEG